MAVAQTTFLAAITSRLLERKTQLEGELRQFATRSASGRGAWKTQLVDIGRSEDENASEVTMYSDNLSLERTLESALRDVTAALARLQAGTYGTCRYCNQPIDEKRLLARPTSSACVKCKTERKANPI